MNNDAIEAQSNMHAKPDNAGTSAQPVKETQETMHDSALVEACESVRQALVQIGGRDFNCSPHQHGMAAAEKAQQALHKLEAALKAKGEQKEKG